MNLTSLANKIRVCRLCPLCESRRLAVPGEGDANARLMLIGEAPGKDEDAIGRPFVGRAGQLLDEVLDQTELERSHIFITNLVKCRPSNNRVPYKLELNTCVNTYLKKQIELIQPDVICLLGETAVKHMTGKQLKQVRSQVLRNEQTYFATYHPAAVARNPLWRESYIRDFKTLAGMVK